MKCVRRPAVDVPSERGICVLSSRKYTALASYGRYTSRRQVSTTSHSDFTYLSKAREKPYYRSIAKPARILSL